MSEVTAFLDLYHYGQCVAEMTVHVRVGYDQAYGNPYLASDVFIEDKTGKRHGVCDSDKAIILGRIHDEQREVWREIEERSDEEYLEGCDCEYPQYDAISMGMR